MFYSQFTGDTITGNWIRRGRGSEETDVINMTTFSPVNTCVACLFSPFENQKDFKGVKSFNQKY